MQHFVKLLGSQIFSREDSVLTITHKGTVVLETERLILRRFTIDDLEPVFNNCWSKPEVWQWTNYKPMKPPKMLLRLRRCLLRNGWVHIPGQTDTAGQSR